MSSATTSGAVNGGDSLYISLIPYMSTTAIGNMVANSETTKKTDDEKLETYEAKLGKWFSSPDHPLAKYTTSQSKEHLRREK